MPFGVLCYCMMWSTLADGAPVSLKFLWYLFTYNFFQICMTVRNTVPSWGCRVHHPLLQGVGTVGWGVPAPASAARDLELGMGER